MPNDLIRDGVDRKGWRLLREGARPLARRLPTPIFNSIAFASLLALAALLSGCGEGRSYPYETTLADSHGNGGWVLFDSAPETYEKGHTVGLEEQVKVRVTGPTVEGRTSDTKLVPVTVLSGKSTGRSGWVASTALGQ